MDQKISNKTILIIVAILFVTISMSTLAFAQKIGRLENSILHINEKLTMTENSISTPRQEATADPNLPIENVDTIQEKRKSYYVDVMSPVGGEKFCLGEEHLIQWKTSPNIDMVTVRLLGGGAYWDLGQFPTSYNEEGLDNHEGTYPWIVGEVRAPHKPFPSGEAYYINIYAHTPPGVRLDGAITGQHEKPFIIEDCRG